MLRKSVADLPQPQESTSSRSNKRTSRWQSTNVRPASVWMGEQLPEGNSGNLRPPTRLSWLKEVNYETEGASSKLRVRRILSTIIASAYFDAMVAIAVFLNLILVVYETNVSAQNDPIPPTVNTIIHVLPFLFLIELIMRAFVHGIPFFRKTTNLVDTAVVLTDLVFMTLEASVGQFPSFSVLRVFRMVRLLRALRAASRFKELHLMMASLISAVRAIFWSSVSLVLILLIFSIVAVEVLHPLVRDIGIEGGFGDCNDCAKSFASVEVSMLTFTQQIVAGDSWGQVTLPVIKKHPWTAMIFFPIFIIVNFGLLNLVMAVIVESSLEARENHQQREQDEVYRMGRQKLAHIFGDLDSDHSGGISLVEILKGIEGSSQFAAFLKEMRISSADVEVMYSVLDEDKSGEVDFDEFVAGLHRMKTETSQAMMMRIRHDLITTKTIGRQQLEMMRGAVCQSLEVLAEDIMRVKQQIGVKEDRSRTVTEIVGQSLDIAVEGSLMSSLCSQMKDSCSQMEDLLEYSASECLELSPCSQHANKEAGDPILQAACSDGGHSACRRVQPRSPRRKQPHTPRRRPSAPDVNSTN